jgi:hypothetical protein
LHAFRVCVFVCSAWQRLANSTSISAGEQCLKCKCYREVKNK